MNILATAAYPMAKARGLRGGKIRSEGSSVCKGYVVTNGVCNVMPGATWAHSIIEAKVMIDILIEANGNSARFWEILREPQGFAEWEEV